MKWKRLKVGKRERKSQAGRLCYIEGIPIDRDRAGVRYMGHGIRTEDRKIDSRLRGNDKRNLDSCLRKGDGGLRTHPTGMAGGAEEW